MILRYTLLFVFLAFTGMLKGALPPEAQVIEAENMIPDNNAWQVKEHFPHWYGGYPSQGKFLAGNTEMPGKAAAVSRLNITGKHRLWVRYLDIVSHRGATFCLTVKQNGRILGEKEFDAESKRVSPEGQAKWGDGFSRFVWDYLEFEGDAGDIDIVLSKGQEKAGFARGARHLDVLLITPDLQYEPGIEDLYPIYVQVRLLPDQPKPVVMHVFGRRAMAPWYTPHMNINRKGIFEGVNNGATNMKDAYLQPGEPSPWIEISRYLAFSSRNNALVFSAMVSYFAKQPENSAAFELVFSRTPDESGIFKRESRNGSGNSMIVSINLAAGTVLSDNEGSRESLEYARNTAPVAGHRSLAFPFLTGLGLEPDRILPEVLQNEYQALEAIGINGLLQKNPDEMSRQRFPWQMGTAFYFHHAEKGCLSRSRLARIDGMMEELAKPYPDQQSPWFLVNLMDEPEFTMKHVTGCTDCINDFTEYLKGQRAELAGAPTADREAGALYYWSMRYRNHLMTEFLRTGTAHVRKYLPGQPTAVNFATELIGGNLVSRGCDWFEIFGSEALTYGWHEDWANASGTYQVAGYQSDVMRAACRPKGQTYGVYNILARHPWDIQAKGFTEIGHGNKAMHFFNYGPYYTPTSDANSRRPEIYQAIKNITFATGPVAGHLMAGRVARGDAAMLLSVTGDIWSEAGDNRFGKERIYLSLLLRHCNYRLDILSEDDLAAELKHYRVLFAVDSHLRRARLPPLMDWIEQGGTLYLGAGALEWDEFNQPLGLGITREKLQISQKPGRAEYEMAQLKTLKEQSGMPVVVGYQAPLNHVFSQGRGKVIFSGFFPGISYMSGSRKINEDIYSVRDYPEAHRHYVKNLNLPVKPRLETDHYLVEANLIEAPEKDIIVLANWSGEPRTVKVTLDHKTYTAQIEAGGYIEIDK